MSLRLRVGDHAVEVRCRLAPKYLFIGTETDLYVDGQHVARSGGLRPSETTAGTVRGADGAVHAFELKVRIGLENIYGGIYTLSMDGEEAARGHIVPDNLAKVCLAALVLPVGLAVLALFLTVALIAARALAGG